MERIGLRLFSYLIGHTPYKELVELSRLAEDKGFEAVVFPELVNDALACAEAVALGTHRAALQPSPAQQWACRGGRRSYSGHGTRGSARGCRLYL